MPAIDIQHVATGAAGGSLVGSRLGTVLLGLLLHLAGDRMPHEHIPDRRFEIESGIGCVLLLAAVRGPLHPAVFGAPAAACPDLEHVFLFRSRVDASSSPATASTAGTGVAVCPRLLNSSSLASSSGSFFRRR